MKRCIQCGAEVEDLGFERCRRCLHPEDLPRGFVPMQARAKVRRVHSDRTCPACGMVFQPSSPRQIYCTRACRRGAATPRAEVPPEVLEAAGAAEAALARLVGLLRSGGRP